MAASVTTPIVLQHFTNQRLKEEVAVLRQRTDDTSTLREDVERLRAETQSSERERSRQRTELARLQSELVALKAHQPQVEASTEPKASTKAESKTEEAGRGSTGKLLLAEEMRNVGFADPASAYQTLQWAKVKGQTNVIFNAVAWGDERTRAEVAAVFAAAPEAVRAKYGSADEFILHLFDRSKPHEDRDILVSSRILEENDVSGEEAALQVEYNWADGSTTKGPMTFVRIGNDWRQALNFEPAAVGKLSVGLQTEGATLANQPVSK